MSGYRDAFAALGQPLDEAFIVPGNFDIGGGAEGARQLMAKRQPPTAIIASNDIAAFGVIAELRTLGLSVPRDLSVAGFDDAPFTQMIWPPLTTISQPVFAMAQRAVDIVLHVISDPHARADYELVPHRIVKRDSVAAPV